MGEGQEGDSERLAAWQLHRAAIELHGKILPAGDGLCGLPEAFHGGVISKEFNRFLGALVLVGVGRGVTELERGGAADAPACPSRAEARMMGQMSGRVGALECGGGGTEMFCGAAVQAG